MRISHHFTDLIDEIAMRTLRFDEVDIGVVPACSAPAVVARHAALIGADERLGKGIGCRGLVGTRRPGEQIGVAQATRAQRGAQVITDLSLTEDALEYVGHPHQSSGRSMRAFSLVSR